MADLDMATIPIVETSASEHDRAFIFTFGAYGDTHLAVFAAHLEDALECAFEWLDENAPGHLMRVDYADAAKDLGLPWPSDDENVQTKVAEAAEVDLTLCTHTTLEHGNAIASWEWGVDEASPDQVKALTERMTYYVYGSGFSGCLYDNGPYFARTLDDAIEALHDTFQMDLTDSEIHAMRSDLEKDGIHYFSDRETAGADYCEVSKEWGEMPEGDE